MAKRIWPGAKITMIEPNERMRQYLDKAAIDLNAQLHAELLGQRDGDRVRFCVMESGSSVYEERSSVPRLQEERTTRSLDSTLLDVDRIGLLKIDAQGYELEILRGAERLISSTDAVLLEIALIEINDGAPLLDEVLVYMKNKSFVAYELLEVHRRPLDGAMNQVDILFVKTDSSLRLDRRHAL